MSKLFIVSMVTLAVGLAASIISGRLSLAPLQFLHGVEISAQDVYGRLQARNQNSMGTSDWLDSDFQCAGALGSRLWASYDLETALRIYEDDSECNRLPEMQLIWKGNLEWLSGNHQGALNYWNQLSDRHLLQYARNLVLNHEIATGLAIATLLEERAATWVDEDDVELLWSLAEIYRLSDQEALGLTHLISAWEHGPRSYEQSYYLGRLLNQEHRCKEAVAIMEEGQVYKTTQLMPDLDFHYYLILGQCHATLDAKNAALHAFQDAREIVYASIGKIPDHEYVRRLTMLEGLERDLTSVED